MPLLYKKTLAAPGSSSTKTGGEMGAGRGNGKRKCGGRGGRRETVRAGESEASLWKRTPFT